MKIMQVKRTDLHAAEEQYMGILEMLLIGIGLSMDAFAVSVCKGLAMEKITAGKAVIIGVWFGGFQALMPLLGYLAGSRFSGYIEKIDHWIAFVLLVLIGANMIREALSEEEEEENESLAFLEMLMLAIATSIDALAVGVTFAFLRVQILTAVLLIGVTTFVISVAGVKIGNVFGLRYKKKAEIVGGVILIGIGTRILLQHLGILP
jgi:putative Mn2+ efflux pump MntP